MNVPRPALIAGIIGTLAFGAVGGAVFDWLTVPLAWLIGAMVITTAAALTGAPLKGPGQLRNVMIGVLGIMLGSAFTSDALDNLGQWLSSLSVLLAFIVAVTTVVALYLVRIGGYDPISAFFSASPGGLATMVVMGGEMGGDERSIALTHSIRVMLTVLVIPFWFRFFHGYEPGGLAVIFGDIGDIAGRDLMILLLCGLGYPLARLLRLPAAPMLGPMALSVAVHLSGVTEAKPPAEIVNLAQVVIGTSIGCRFVNIPVMRVLKLLMVSAGGDVFHARPGSGGGLRRRSRDRPAVPSPVAGVRARRAGRDDADQPRHGHRYGVRIHPSPASGGIHGDGSAFGVCADQKTTLLTVIGANNFGDIGEAVPFQVGRQVAVDGINQPRPFEYQRRIELHQRRAGADLGVGVGPRGDAADANQRQPAFGEFVEIGQHLRRRIEQGFAAESPGLVPLAIGEGVRPLDGGVGGDDPAEALFRGHLGDVLLVVFGQVRRHLEQQRRRVFPAGVG